MAAVEPMLTIRPCPFEIMPGITAWQQRNTPLRLIRHAYVRTAQRSKGIGGKLLCELRKLTPRPVLIGTWAAATWAIRFYEKHGFRLVTPAKKNRLLKKYWNIPERLVETSVVLGDARWFADAAKVTW